MCVCICDSVYKTTADYIPVDLSKESTIDTYVREIRKLYPHGVDILVNNAGNYVSQCSVTMSHVIFLTG